MTILMRLSPLILVALLQTGTTEKGWTDLFNGTDFSGWKMWNPESFTIEVRTNDPAVPGTTAPSTITSFAISN